MIGYLCQHVIQKAEAGLNAVLATAIQVQRHPDARFGGLTAHFGAAGKRFKRIGGHR
ncbi:hypothetical protein [Thermanaerothrix sp.]|uniref:hypothetical protein n=1 Tax=Thermanaerothrix sp. TaxID=2972675 RepID=UPI003C7E785A